MHRFSNPVPNKLSHDTVSMSFNMNLNGSRNVNYSVPKAGITDAFVKSLLCDIQKSLG